MKRSTVLVGIGIIILGISILGGLSLMDSESIEKTKESLPIEPELQQQEKVVSSNVNCSPTAFGGVRCLP